MADQEQTSRLRPAYVLASSLAAVTGAFLASRLGVYGTVIGVGVISLFSTIGTDVYVRSLDRTRQLAARSKVRTIAPATSGPAVETVELPRAVDSDELLVTADTRELPDDAETGALPDDAETGALPEPPDTRELQETADATWRPDGSVRPPDAAEVAEPATDSDASRRTRARILIVGAAAVASFALALVLITGIESVSGSSLSGGGRTTLGELIVDGGNSSDSRDTDFDDADEPEQPVPTPEPTTPWPTVTDFPDDGEQGGTVPPAEEAPDGDQPSDPGIPSPSPTESPTSDPTEPPADDGEDSPASSADSQPTG
ncbi:MAG TPA: hypothetical protein VFY84_06465 [Jiangellales bacterium]|nr:hypothetical protein [Jiangellales bacterium]